MDNARPQPPYTLVDPTVITLSNNAPPNRQVTPLETLFHAQDGTWVAIARWPDRDARTRCFEHGSLDPEASRMVREAVLESFNEMELESSDDLWVLPTPIAP
jgi:hypothetical protein